MAAPFVLGLAVLTVTALLGKSVKLVSIVMTGAAGLKFVFWFILAVLPSLLIYIIPVSFLVAVLAAFSRLSADSEIRAMNASGLSLYTISRPVFMWALISGALTLLMTLYFFAWGNIKAERLLIGATARTVITGIEEKTFYDRFKGIVLYVDHISQGTGELEGVFISEKGEPGRTKVFFARRAELGTSAETNTLLMKLMEGSVHRFDSIRNTYHVARFSTYMLKVNLAGGGGISRTNRQLYPGELAAKIRRVRAAGGNPAPHIIDLHKRFALPASIFVFALLGVPLGLQRIRSAHFTGFSVALGVVLVYYVLSTALEGMGENGVINPVLAVWGSDIITGAAGLFIFHRTARQRPAFSVVKRLASFVPFKAV